MTSRQFLACCLMLAMGVILLDLERLREWWENVGGDTAKVFARSDVVDSYEYRLGAYANLSFASPSVIYMHPQDHADLCQELAR